ncbi:nucleotide-binding domain-containing protein [Agrococcus sediminis]|uniref:nucleotide-binding domain-containing protein n=1 Tax=Agrococcus sediminis TaxID=2599924 RepID=UPI003436C9C2
MHGASRRAERSATVSVRPQRSRAESSQARHSSYCRRSRRCQFIEGRFPVDITHSVTIDCEVTQDGWRRSSLREMLRGRSPLMANKDLRFKVISCTVAHPYELKWKVLNRGAEAERRNDIRGQIIGSSQPNARHERTSFRGEHVVECFVVKDGVVVARDRIDVPISSASGVSAGVS